METVILKNGTEEVATLVALTTSILLSLLEERPLILYDLVMKCRDRDYQFFGNNEEHLKSLKLIDRDGSIHGSIRNIVLSAAKGDGLDLIIKSPIRTWDRNAT